MTTKARLEALLAGAVTRTTDLEQLLSKRTEELNAEVTAHLATKGALAQEVARVSSLDDLYKKQSTALQAAEIKVRFLETAAKRDALERAVIERECDYWRSVVELARLDAEANKVSAWLPVLAIGGLIGAVTNLISGRKWPQALFKSTGAPDLSGSTSVAKP